MIEPLLKITTIPIDVEVKINKASYERIDNAEMPKAKVTRDKGEFNIEAEPVRIHIDNTPVFDSIGLKKPTTRGIEEGQKGLSVSYQAVARIAQDGKDIADGKTTVQEIAKRQTMEDATKALNLVTAFIPESGPDISWSDGKLNINYTADKLNIDFELQKTRFKFIPGSVELIINNLPRVEIEYTGEPIYFPASAAPGYDAKA